MNEIYIYGDIGGSEGITAQGIADQISKITGDLNVRINSCGGDIFTAHAIHNLLKSHEGLVTVMIDGICASAATVIACAADSVKIAKNGLYLIHNPTAGLFDFFDEKELEKHAQMLNKIKATIIEIYAEKFNLVPEEISIMMNEGACLRAEEALEIKAVDEIMDAVPVENRNGILYVNKMKASKVANYYADVKAVEIDAVQDAVQKERERIMGINELKGGNDCINAYLEKSIETGKELEEVREYVAAMKETKPSYDFRRVIEDQLNSGSAEVQVNIPVNNEIEILADIANKLRVKK